MKKKKNHKYWNNYYGLQVEIKKKKVFSSQQNETENKVKYRITCLRSPKETKKERRKKKRQEMKLTKLRVDVSRTRCIKAKWSGKWNENKLGFVWSLRQQQQQSAAHCTALLLLLYTLLSRTPLCIFIIFFPLCFRRHSQTAMQLVIVYTRYVCAPEWKAHIFFFKE